MTIDLPKDLEKIVHDAVAAVQGVHSESEGQEPSRRVVVLLD